MGSKELAGAIGRMKFAAEVCEMQRREGSYLIFEQPHGSRAWDLGSIKEMMTKRGVCHHHAPVHVWAEDKGRPR